MVYIYLKQCLNNIQNNIITFIKAYRIIIGYLDIIHSDSILPEVSVNIILLKHVGISHGVILIAPQKEYKIYVETEREKKRKGERERERERERESSLLQ